MSLTLAQTSPSSLIAVAGCSAAALILPSWWNRWFPFQFFGQFLTIVSLFGYALNLFSTVLYTQTWHIDGPSLLLMERGYINGPSRAAQYVHAVSIGFSIWNIVYPGGTRFMMVSGLFRTVYHVRAITSCWVNHVSFMFSALSFDKASLYILKLWQVKKHYNPGGIVEKLLAVWPVFGLLFTMLFIRGCWLLFKAIGENTNSVSVFDRLLIWTACAFQLIAAFLAFRDVVFPKNLP